MVTHPIIWTSKTEYYDIEDGMQITKQKAIKEYIIVKTEKHVKLNVNKTKGYIEYAKQCRRNPQQKLFPDNT